jgi:hypothetical protein
VELALAEPFKGIAMLFSDSNNPLVDSITKTTGEIGYSLKKEPLKNAAETLKEGNSSLMFFCSG